VGGAAIPRSAATVIVSSEETPTLKSCQLHEGISVPPSPTESAPLRFMKPTPPAGHGLPIDVALPVKRAPTEIDRLLTLCEHVAEVTIPDASAEVLTVNEQGS